jgi:hypothetical protein
MHRNKIINFGGDDGGDDGSYDGGGDDRSNKNCSFALQI